MSHSDEFLQLKKYYHEKQYDVRQVETHWSSDNGFIDLGTTPAENPAGYYDLVEYFIDPPKENRREDAYERVANGEDNLPDQVNIDAALDTSLSGDMQNSELKAVVENYHEAVALRTIYTQRIQDELGRYKQNRAHDENRFNEYHNRVGDILQEAYFTESPLVGYREFRDTCITDIEFLLEKLRDIQRQYQRQMEQVEQDDQGRLDGFTAIPTIMDQYARYYELAGDPLRDLVISLEGTPSDSLESTKDTLDYLAETGHEQLADMLDPALRNGAFHVSYEIDEDTGVVRIFRGKHKQRYVDAEYRFDDLISEFHFIEDVVPAMIFSYIVMNEVVTLRYLQSRDFVSQVLQEADPAFFD